MALSFEDNLKLVIGNLLIQSVQVQTQLALLTEKLEALEKKEKE